MLLDYLAGRAPDVACQVARATGVQSEMELAFAGLHQLCGPMLSRAERLPVPQRDALRIAFGLAEGPPPDRFFVGLALLKLLLEAGRERPLICLVDDQQWLDRASAQALGFAARRLAADPVGLVFAAPLTGRIEDSFARQLAALPDQTRRLVQLAAADPSGDRSLVWRAAGRLGIPAAAGEPAEEAGLVEFGAQIRFRHPQARSAAYRSAALPVRRQLHAALAEATDPIADPDRPAWHLAQAAVGPDEEVTAELERSAGRLRPELAGTQLLYGEWLRRENRRADARDQLRAAHRQLTSTGMGAFAERARRELLATGAAVPEHGAEAREQLTPQEEQIARLARDGLSNPEIGAQLFVSARTVQYHLRKVFTKLGISSRRELPTALARRGQDGLSA